MDGYTQAHAERQTEGETLLYDIKYSRLYDIKGPKITRGKAELYDCPMVVSQEEDR